MARLRDQSTLLTFPQREVSVWGSTVSPVDRTLSVIQQDSMVDVVTPSFKKRSASGEIFISPMTKAKSKPVLHQILFWKQKGTGAGFRRWTVDRSNLFGDYVPWNDPVILDKVKKMESLAITDAYASVGEPDLSTLTELAELKETLGFLASPVKKMVQLTRDLRSHVTKVDRLNKRYTDARLKWLQLPAWKRAKRKQPEPPKLPKLKLGKFEATDIPSAWLAYRYAIMPLIYSFQDIQKHLDREIKPVRLTARAKQKEMIDLKQIGSWTSYYLPYGDTKERLIRTGMVEVTSRAGVLYAADWSLTRQLGVQLHQIPAALYEIIPLSFVTDWLHNGASAYQALTAELRSNKILGAWVVTTMVSTMDAYVEAEPLNSDTACASGVHTTTVTGKWSRRTPASMSDIQFHFRVEMNSKRIADGLSLIATMLGSIKKK